MNARNIRSQIINSRQRQAARWACLPYNKFVGRERPQGCAPPVQEIINGTSGNLFSTVGRFCEAAQSFEKSPTRRVGLQHLTKTLNCT